MKTTKLTFLLGAMSWSIIAARIPFWPYPSRDDTMNQQNLGQGPRDIDNDFDVVDSNPLNKNVNTRIGIL